MLGPDSNVPFVYFHILFAILPSLLALRPGSPLVLIIPILLDVWKVDKHVHPCLIL